MENTEKRIHIQIKGSNNSKNSINELLNKAKSLGLKGYSNGTQEEVVIVAEGKKSELWKLVKHLTVLRKKEAVFYFSELNLA